LISLKLPLILNYVQRGRACSPSHHWFQAPFDLGVRGRRRPFAPCGRRSILSRKLVSSHRSASRCCPGTISAWFEPRNDSRFTTIAGRIQNVPGKTNVPKKDVFPSQSPGCSTGKQAATGRPDPSLDTWFGSIAVWLEPSQPAWVRILSANILSPSFIA